MRKEKRVKVKNEFQMNSKCQDLLSLLLTIDDPEKISENIFEKFRKFHDDETFTDDVNFAAEVIDLTDNVQFAKALNLLELNVHDQNKLKVFKCFKERVGTSRKAMKLIKLSNEEPSVIETLKSKTFEVKFLREIKDISTTNPRFVSTKTHLLMSLQIASHFIDLTKDLFLLITVLAIVPITLASVKNFGGQIALVLLAGTFLPEIANLFTAWKPDGIDQTSFLKILFLFIAPILSSVSLYISRRYQACRDSILLNNFVDKKNIPQTIDDLKTNKSELDFNEQREKVWKVLSLRLRFNEMLFEHTLQILVLLIFTALILTETQTVQGLEQLFTQDTLEWIVISAILSIRSLTNHFQIRVDHQKNYTMPLAGKVILTLLYFSSVVVRFTAILLYFAPGLGLMNLLMHWKMGNIPGKDAHGDCFCVYYFYDR